MSGKKRGIKTKSTHLVNQWKKATLCETRHGEIRKIVPENCQVTEWKCEGGNLNDQTFFGLVSFLKSFEISHCFLILRIYQIYVPAVFKPFLHIDSWSHAVSAIVLQLPGSRQPQTCSFVQACFKFFFSSFFCKPSFEKTKISLWPRQFRFVHKKHTRVKPDAIRTH